MLGHPPFATAKRPLAHVGLASLLTLGIIVGCSEPGPVAPTLKIADTRDVEGIGSAAVIVSNRFAYVAADKPASALYTWYAANPRFSRNALGGANRIRRVAKGIYDVRLGGMAKGSGTRSETVLVTPTDSGPIRCHVSAWYDQGTDLEAHVYCVDQLNNPRNSTFTLLMVGNNSLLGRSGFAFADQPSSVFFEPDSLYAWTNGPGPITISRPATGSYNVDLTLPRPPGGSTESYFVSNRYPVQCMLNSWGNTANVGCYSAFNGGIAQNQKYDILLVDGGRPSGRLGFALANDRTASFYVPDPRWTRNSSGGRIVITRTNVGHYRVNFDRLRTWPGHTEIVQVTPYGTKFVTCNPFTWGNSGAALNVSVVCRDLQGAPVDSHFTVLVIE